MTLPLPPHALHVPNLAIAPVMPTLTVPVPRQVPQFTVELELDDGFDAVDFLSAFALASAATCD